MDQHALGRHRERGLRARSVATSRSTLYHSLARLTRYTAERYGIPLDREHIIGHDQVPGPTAAYQAGMHWDPGHVLRLGALHEARRRADHVGKGATRPAASSRSIRTSRQPAAGHRVRRLRLTPVAVAARELPLPPHGAERDRAARRRSAPARPGRRRARRTGATRPSPARRSPSPSGRATGSRSGTAARRRGSTTRRARTRSRAAARSSRRRPASPRSPSTGARTRRASRPRRSATRSLPARRTSRRISSAPTTTARRRYNAPETYSVVKSDEQFYEISFNHRIAFVRATDVDTVS